MRTTISFSVTRDEAKKSRDLAAQRGFENLSDYIRFLLSTDDADLISPEEILTRASQTKKFQKQGKLIRAKSMADLL